MYNWKNARNYRRFRDENGNVIANIIYVDGEEVAVSDKEIEVVPVTPNRLRGKLSNLNLYQVLFYCCADFHAMLSFRMSQRKERRMSQRVEYISQFRFYLSLNPIVFVENQLILY